MTPARALLAGLLAALAATAAAGELTPEQQRGKEIYLRGTTADGAAITALMGDDRIEVPATALPCVNCHGFDGRGRPEGGVTPTEVTWEAMTRPYAVKTPSGRERPPYDRRAVKRAISLGIDPGGSDLHIAMPRYRMAYGDLEALVAYLEVLSADRDPGVGERELTLGLLLPPAAGPLAPLGSTLRTVIEGWAKELNEKGGVYGRELRLAALELPADPAARRAAAERFLDAEGVFALVSPFFAGADAELAALAAERGVPAIGPFTLDAAEGFPVNRQVFHLWSGISGQARALARFAGRSGREAPNAGSQAGAGTAPPPAVIAEPDDGRLADAAAAIAEELEHVGDPPPERLSLGASADPAALAARLRDRGAADLYLLDTGPAGAALLAAAAPAGWRPRVLVPGSLAGGALLAAARDLGGPLVLAYPTLPGDRSERALDELARLTTGLPPGQETAAVTALAAAHLLAEGLQRAGRDLSREKLITALETLYDHPTELTPNLTYGPNRRIGARGVYIVELDPATGRPEPRGGWIEVER